jgi:hypothetical protein
MSRIIYTDFSDHNDLNALDAKIKRYYAIQQTLGKSREYLVGLAMKYRNRLLNYAVSIIIYSVLR